MTDGAPLRVLVVDDEPLARRRLRDLLAAEGVIEVAEAASGDAAVHTIRSERPDVVFLDVQMPGKNGLDVVREVGAASMPATVFVTAHDQHAVEAFELAAVDYLVKPFDDERFEQAFRRARRRIELEEVGRLSTRLLAVLQEGAPSPRASDGASGEAGEAGEASVHYLERIVVETRGEARAVPIADVDFITASGPYAEIHTGGTSYLIRERMQALEEQLDPRIFFRTHRSAIVRLDRVESLRRAAGGDYAVRLRTGGEVRVSRSRIEELSERLGLTR